MPNLPNGLCMLPGGVLAIASCEAHSRSTVKFVAARNDSDPQALAACQASSLAARRFEWLMGLAHTNDGLLACSLGDSSAALYKFALDGSMDELATVRALADYGQGFTRCVVHQQTQRTYALGDDEEGRCAVAILDANLQVIATVEDTGGVPEDFDDVDEDWCPIRDVAVHGDQVVVLTTDHHSKGSGLRLLDLDGRFLRTVAAGQFHNPWVVTVSHGRAFVIDELAKLSILGKALYIIDIQSGDILQITHLELHGSVSAILVDGDEIFISGYTASTVVVLRFAGSEA